jgi:circadian clock protein KaiC
VCGSAGCGKSLMGMEFLVRGAIEFDEPGVLMTFEEPVRDVAQNVMSLGFDVDDLVAKKKMVLDHVRVERSEIMETGEFDLDGIFIRLNHAIDSIGAKRVVLDTLEALFGGFSNEAILRAELRRLFEWLKEKKVTAIITGEKGEASLTRQGLEEYVSDCVIFLDHRIIDQVSTRRLRVVKYRGSVHGTNEYPFLIDEDGITVLPITSVGLDHEVSSERISSGVKELDEMLGDKGYYRGSSILVSGSAGTGKSSLAAHFADAACRGGERCLYFAFEESPSQIIRNMRGIGMDLGGWVGKGLLKFHASRPSLQGLETHLSHIQKLVKQFKPAAVVIDPVSNLVNVGNPLEVNSMLLRLVDRLKMDQVTAFFTNLIPGGSAVESTEVGISSLMDTWLLLRDIEINGERNRGIYVLKSRGMAHSNQIREFLLTSEGIRLVDVYLGPEGVLTGSSRQAQEAKERAARVAERQELERKQRELQRRREAMEVQIAGMRASFEAEEQEALKEIDQEQGRSQARQQDRLQMAISRKANGANASRKNGSARKESRR